MLKKKVEETEQKLVFDDLHLVKLLVGEHSQHIKFIEKNLGIGIHLRGNHFSIVGEEAKVALAGRLLQEVYFLLESNYPLSPGDMDYALRILSANETIHLKDIFLDTVYLSSRRRLITPKSVNQKRYIDAIRNFDIVIGIGPAGTGKTYLAMAMAIAALSRKEVDRIILARPAVEAGEKLGFLPGDLVEKVNPYLRPLYDALHDMMDMERATKMIQHGIIEVAPLAFMRGRTLNDSFVILDEAQNPTSEQMKMFLTRLGFSSKAVITGDITQVDLPHEKTSGLIQIQKILKHIEGIRFVYFNEQDVVRHPLVQEIIKAYDRNG